MIKEKLIKDLRQAYAYLEANLEITPTRVNQLTYSTTYLDDTLKEALIDMVKATTDLSRYLESELIGEGGDGNQAA